MARSTIKNSAGKVSSIRGENGKVVGVSATDPALTLLPSHVVYGARQPDGTIPVNVTLPIGYDPATHGVMLWSPATRRTVSFSAGSNPLLPVDLGYPADTNVIPAFFRTWGPSGAISPWTPRNFHWADAPVPPRALEPVTVITPGSITTTGYVGDPITYNGTVWDGDFTQARGSLESSPNGLDPWTDLQSQPAIVPNTIGTRIRPVFSALGPDENGVQRWHYNRGSSIVIAAAPAPALAADEIDPTSIFRPSAQTATYSGEFTFPDAPTFTAMQASAVEPPTEASWVALTEKSGSPGTWVLGNVSGMNFSSSGGQLLRFRYANGGGWSPASPRVLLSPPAGAVDPLAETFRPSNAALTSAMAEGYQDYRIVREGGNAPYGGEGNPSTGAWAKWTTVTVALAAFAGVTDTFPFNGGNVSPITKTINQIKRWVDNAGDKGYIGRSGYHGQHELRAIATLCIARKTPAVWDALTTTEKDRVRCIIKACLIASCAVSSQGTPNAWIQAGVTVVGGERSLRGYSSGGANVPNFSLPPNITPHVCAAFMAYDTGVANAAQLYLDTFTRKTLHDEILAARGTTSALDELEKSFRREWTAAVQIEHNGLAAKAGPGHTDAQLAQCLRPGGNAWVSRRGFSLAQTAAAINYEWADRMFSKVVRPGPLNVMVDLDGAGTGNGPVNVGDVGPAPYNNTAQKHGIKTAATANQLHGCLGRPTVAGQAGSATIVADWADLPNKGATGMVFELDTTDGGAARAGNARSSATYAMSGLGALMCATIAMIVLGRINAATFSAASKARFLIGIDDFNFRAAKGHRSHANGGYGNGGKLEDFGAAYIANNGVRWSVFQDQMNKLRNYLGTTGSFPTYANA